MMIQMTLLKNQIRFVNFLEYFFPIIVVSILNTFSQFYFDALMLLHIKTKVICSRFSKVLGDKTFHSFFLILPINHSSKSVFYYYYYYLPSIHIYFV